MVHLAKMAKMTPRLRYVGQLGPQDGQLGSILGGILAHFSELERDLSKNSGSVKMWWVFEGWGLVLEVQLGAILDDVGSKINFLGYLWRHDRPRAPR